MCPILSQAYAAERFALINMSSAATQVPPGTPPSLVAEATYPGGFPRSAAAQALDHTSAGVHLKIPRD